MKRCRDRDEEKASEDSSAYCPSCDTVEGLVVSGSRTGDRTGRGACCRPCSNAEKEEPRVRVHGGSRAYHLMHRYGVPEAEIDAAGAPCAGSDPRSTSTTTT